MIAVCGVYWFLFVPKFLSAIALLLLEVQRRMRLTIALALDLTTDNPENYSIGERDSEIRLDVSILVRTKLKVFFTKMLMLFTH